MGRVAADLAERVLVTTDNPRSEDPEEIVEEILAGIPSRDVAPSLRADSVEVVADRRTLTVRGRVSRSPTDAEFEHREFELADYHRAFTLTEDLDTDRISGKLRDGVLRVEIPKSERVQPKKIPVRAN